MRDKRLDLKGLNGLAASISILLLPVEDTKDSLSDQNP